NELRVFKIRIHPRCWIEKKSPQQPYRLRGVSLVAFKVVSERQRLNGRFQLIEAAMVCNLVNLRIALAVTTNVGQAIGRFWIGPEVRRLGHVIVLISTR